MGQQGKGRRVAAALGGLILQLACSSKDEGADPGGGGASAETPSGGGPSDGAVPGGIPSGGAVSGGAPSDGDISGGTPSGGVTSGGVSSSVGASGGASSGGTGGGAADSGGAGNSAGADGGGPGSGGQSDGLSWPIDCIPGSTCIDIGYPDVDGDGLAFDCSPAGYQGHEGTDISITQAQMDAGLAVRAAADGTVFFASDGKYDHCPNDTEPDCQAPASFMAGATEGTTVCTELGPYCNPPGGSCFWCFAGGNVIVLLHDSVEGVFATRYDHLKKGSVQVSVGDTVSRGQQMAEVGSAGNSTGPHLHFEVWAGGYYDLTEPWMGSCGPNTTRSLWANEPPWL